MNNSAISANFTTGKRKVAIIGVGYVGASIAYALTVRNIAREIVLIDKDIQRAQGESSDIRHGVPFMGTSFVYAGGYADCADCDLIIICAGRNRRSGETRRDLVDSNVDIMKNVIASLKPYYTHGAILVVANPVDILTQVASDLMQLPNGRVFGSGCILDTSRLTACIADYLSLSTDAVKAIVVGEHGDEQTPVWSRVAIAGVPIDEYCEAVGLLWGDTQRQSLHEKVRSMGASIIRNKGKTHYGIATCVCYLADAVLNQRQIIAPVSSPLVGEYGVKGVSLSVPSIVGVNGVERRLEERWSEEEYVQFLTAADRLRECLESL